MNEYTGAGLSVVDMGAGAGRVAKHITVGESPQGDFAIPPGGIGH
jgi:hypothetical protein